MIQLKEKGYTIAYTILKNYSKELEEKDLPAVIKKTLEMPDADHNPYAVTEEMLVDAFDKLSNYNKTKTLLEG